MSGPLFASYAPRIKAGKPKSETEHYLIVAYVYILRCRDGSYYTGSTSDLELRLREHETGAYPDCYTASRRPVTLVYSYETSTMEEAFALERQIKGWSRAKKEALIAGRFDLLVELSKRR